MAGSKQGRFRLAIYAGVVLVVVGVGSFWLLQRKRATEQSNLVYGAAVALAHCVFDDATPATAGDARVSMRRRLELTAAKARPLEECRADRDKLRARIDAYRSLRFLRSPDAVRSLGSIGDRLGATDFGIETRALVTRNADGAIAADSIATLALDAVLVSCALGKAEQAFAKGPCPPGGKRPTAARPPTPRVAFDATLEEPARDVTFAATGRGGQPQLFVAARDGAVARAWHARPAKDTSAWTVAELGSSPATGAPSPPIPLFWGDELVGLFEPGARQLWSTVGGKLDKLGGVPESPEGSDVALGTPVAMARRGANGSRPLFVTVRGPTADDESSRVVYFEAGDEAAEAERAVGSGTVFALWNDGAPKIAIESIGDDGFVHITQTAVPLPGKRWPEPIDAQISYTPTLTTPSGREQRCGIAGEQTFPWIGHSPKHEVLVVLGETETSPYKLKLNEGETVTVLCGTCPVTALSKSTQGLRLHLPVRRKAYGGEVPVPLAFDAAAAKTASGTCTGDGFVIAYVAGGRVLVQRSGAEKFAFGPARVLASTTDLGPPLDVRLVSLGERVLALWRRALPKEPRGVRIEYATSDDAGETWR